MKTINLYNSNLLSYTDGLPTFHSVSDLDSIPNLRDNDVDEQLGTSIYSQYYSVSELASLEANSQDLSILHMNERSLSCHHDDLLSLLKAASESLGVIEVSEMRHSENSPIITNIDIPGYSTKSLSQNGGVGLYAKSFINSINRVDLNYHCYDFETIWIETKALDEKNQLFCCVYRHPNSSINIFTGHFIVTLTKLNNKQVFLMGDFKVDLLNYDTYSSTKGFA